MQVFINYIVFKTQPTYSLMDLTALSYFSKQFLQTLFYIFH